MENPIKMDDLGLKKTPYFWFNTQMTARNPPNCSKQIKDT